MKNSVFDKMKWALLAVAVIVVEQMPMLLIKKGQASWQVAMISILFLVITVATYLLARKINLLDAKAFSEGDHAILWIGLGFAAMTVAKIIGALVLFIEKGPNANTANQAALEQAGLPAVLLFILAAIVAPVVEETVFRGLIFGKIFGQESYLGLIVSSLLFGALHMPSDWGSWIVYGGMGLVLGFVYMKTKKLEYSMIIHFINNALSVILMLLLPYLK